MRQGMGTGRRSDLCRAGITYPIILPYNPIRAYVSLGSLLVHFKKNEHHDLACASRLPSLTYSHPWLGPMSVYKFTHALTYLHSNRCTKGSTRPHQDQNRYLVLLQRDVSHFHHSTCIPYQRPYEQVLNTSYLPIDGHGARNSAGLDSGRRSECTSPQQGQSSSLTAHLAVTRGTMDAPYHQPAWRFAADLAVESMEGTSRLAPSYHCPLLRREEVHSRSGGGSGRDGGASGGGSELTMLNTNRWSDRAGDVHASSKLRGGGSACATCRKTQLKYALTRSLRREARWQLP